MRVTFDLTDDDLKYFRRVMKEVRDRFKSSSEEDIIEATRDLLQSIKKTKAPDFVQQRIGKLKSLVDMREDEEWALGGKDRERVVRGMAYFAEPNDIIPDRVPVLGFLDDAIMVELALRELRHELEAYRDFCEFRERDLADPKGKSPKQRQTRLDARREELHARMRRRRQRSTDPELELLE